MSCLRSARACFEEFADKIKWVCQLLRGVIGRSLASCRNALDMRKACGRVWLQGVLNKISDD
jgi:hypothetical protein